MSRRNHVISTFPCLLTKYWRIFRIVRLLSLEHFTTGRWISKLKSVDGWWIHARGFLIHFLMRELAHVFCFVAMSHSWAEGSLFQRKSSRSYYLPYPFLSCRNFLAFYPRGRDSVGNWESGSQTPLVDLEKGVRWRTPDRSYCEERGRESECTRESAEKERDWEREGVVVTAIWSLSSSPWEMQRVRSSLSSVVFTSVVLWPTSFTLFSLPLTRTILWVPPLSGHLTMHYYSMYLSLYSVWCDLRSWNASLWFALTLLYLHLSSLTFFFWILIDVWSE